MPRRPAMMDLDSETLLPFTQENRRHALRRQRRSMLLLAVVVGLAGAWALARSATAQNTDDSPTPSVRDNSDTSDSGRLNSGGDSNGESPGGDSEGPRSLLDTLIEGGFVGLLIILLSMVAVGFIVEHFMTIRKSVLMPEEVLGELEQMIAAGQVDDAADYCRQSNSLVTNCVLAGLERYQGSEFGFAEYKAAVEEAGEDQTAKLYRKTEVLGLIGSITPMLGLTGTVLGMIRAFNVIASKGGMARPDELAGGIGQALVTTLMGLVVAIPAMVAFTYFRNQIDSIVAEAGKRIERIMMPLGRQK